MKQKLLHYTKELALFILFMIIFANAVSWYKSQGLSKEPLPELQAKLINNLPYSPNQRSVTVVHFWASWCPTCKLEASNIEAIKDKTDLITIAVNSGSDFEIKKYLDDNGLSFDVINDKDGSLSKVFNISAYPTTLIYDKEKRLVFSEVGYTSSLGLLLRIWWAGL